MDIKKILQPFKKSILIIMILIGVSIAFFVAANMLIKPGKNEECITYNTLISLDKDEEGKYVKLEMTKVPFKFATKTTENNSKLNYYFAVDENKYLYIIRLTNKTYQELEEKYNKNPEEFKYELKGYIFDTPAELKKLAIEEYNYGLTEGKITMDDFESYFGKTYLDEKVTPNTDIAAVLGLLGFFTSIVSVVTIIVYVRETINIKKTFKKYSKEELETELLNTSTQAYPKQKIYLTDKYIITNTQGLSVIPYEDIYWIYRTERNYRGQLSIFLTAFTKDKKGHTIVCINKMFKTSKEEDETLTNILTTIATKNTSILVGFTPENKQAYKELPKIKE